MTLRRFFLLSSVLVYGTTCTDLKKGKGTADFSSIQKDSVDKNKRDSILSSAKKSNVSLKTLAKGSFDFSLSNMELLAKDKFGTTWSEKDNNEYRFVIRVSQNRLIVYKDKATLRVHEQISCEELEYKLGLESFSRSMRVKDQYDSLLVTINYSSQLADKGVLYYFLNNERSKYLKGNFNIQEKVKPLTEEEILTH